MLHPTPNALSILHVNARLFADRTALKQQLNRHCQLSSGKLVVVVSAARFDPKTLAELEDIAKVSAKFVLVSYCADRDDYLQTLAAMVGQQSLIAVSEDDFIDAAGPVTLFARHQSGNLRHALSTQTECHTAKAMVAMIHAPVTFPFKQYQHISATLSEVMSPLSRRSIGLVERPGSEAGYQLDMFLFNGCPSAQRRSLTVLEFITLAQQGAETEPEPDPWVAVPHFLRNEASHRLPDCETVNPQTHTRPIPSVGEQTHSPRQAALKNNSKIQGDPIMNLTLENNLCIVPGTIPGAFVENVKNSRPANVVASDFFNEYCQHVAGLDVSDEDFDNVTEAIASEMQRGRLEGEYDVISIYLA